MKYLIYLLVGMAAMYAVLKLLSRKGTNEPRGNTSKAASNLLKTQETANLVRTNEFRELVKTNEFRSFISTLARDEVKEITKALIS